MDNKLNTVSHRFRTNVRFVKDESGTLGSTQMPHLETPHPDQFPELALKYFDKLQPACPKLLKTGWKAWLFPAHRRAIQEANQQRHTVYLVHRMRCLPKRRSPNICFSTRTPPILIESTWYSVDYARRPNKRESTSQFDRSLVKASYL